VIQDYQNAEESLDDAEDFINQA